MSLFLSAYKHAFSRRRLLILLRSCGYWKGGYPTSQSTLNCTKLIWFDSMLKMLRHFSYLIYLVSRWCVWPYECYWKWSIYFILCIVNWSGFWFMAWWFNGKYVIIMIEVSLISIAICYVKILVLSDIADRFLDVICFCRNFIKCIYGSCGRLDSPFFQKVCGIFRKQIVLHMRLKGSPKPLASLTISSSPSPSNLFLVEIWSQYFSSFIDTSTSIASKILYLIPWGVSEPPEFRQAHTFSKFHPQTLVHPSNVQSLKRLPFSSVPESCSLSLLQIYTQQNWLYAFLPSSLLFLSLLWLCHISTGTFPKIANKKNQQNSVGNYCSVWPEY